MELLHSFIDFFLHIDVHLASVIAEYGVLTYGILFLIIFCETGLIVTPFLPGDSLLFAAGAFAGSGSFSIALLGALLAFAAIAGNIVNYTVGRTIGEAVERLDGRWIRREHLEKTRQFFAKYGAKAIIITRFMPIIRTMAPFVAGVGRMPQSVFHFYNVVGGLVWIGLFLGAGYFFGSMPFVEKNFSLVIMAIIVLSVLPPIYEWWKSRRA